MSFFSQAFEITDEDLEAVLCAMDLPHTESEVALWRPKLNFARAVKAALHCDNIDSSDQ